jgi:hypothetical protein
VTYIAAKTETSATGTHAAAVSAARVPRYWVGFSTVNFGDLKVKIRIKAALVAAIGIAAWNAASAGCVVGAKMATTFTVLDSHTLILHSGSHNIMIKTFAFFYPSSSITVLKDSFCSFESAVLYIDGQVVDAQQVEKL